MKYTDIRSMTPAELQKQLAEKREELQSMRFKVHEHQLKTVRDIRALRKTIARMETALSAAQNAS